jgi:site-specific DNA-methyltransferase (adenine-specific)
MPMQSTENISVFYRRGEKPEYHPQWWYNKPYKVTASKRKKQNDIIMGANSSIANLRPVTESPDGRRYPKNIIRVNREFPRIHPTQKPVELLTYLIRTYQVSGRETRVLDFCAGSCSTGVASLQIPGVSCVLIEKDTEYCEAGAQRLASVIL